MCPTEAACPGEGHIEMSNVPAVVSEPNSQPHKQIPVATKKATEESVAKKTLLSPK